MQYKATIGLTLWINSLQYVIERNESFSEHCGTLQWRGLFIFFIVIISILIAGTLVQTLKTYV